MNLRFTVTGEDYNEDIILHKTDNGHFDERAMQRLGRSGEEILWDLLGLLNTEEWHEAWMNAEIKTDQEIMILDHTLGVAIPIPRLQRGHRILCQNCRRHLRIPFFDPR